MDLNGMTTSEHGRPMWRGLQLEYQDRLPVTNDTPVVTLREGNTPMIYAEALSERANARVWLKYEGANPTGSFKDRGMFLAMSKAKEAGARAVICASTGNTSASAAAYAAKAGLTCGVIVPEGNIAMGKLAQALITGAKVLQVRGNFDQALEMCQELAEGGQVTLVNSVNPYRIEGQKTGAFEVCDFLGQAPDVHIMPVGNAGNITAYWRGYKEYKADGIIDALPVMRGFQAAGAAPLVLGHKVEHPQTIATAIRIGNPASGKYALEAAEESNGSIRAVTDKQILEAYRLVASQGVFCEPASAASVAGLLTLVDSGEIPAGATVVCILTGHGLKDPDWAISCGSRPTVIDPSLDAAAEALGLAD
ncbi:threonine synthase [Stomatohabitans albus]|uniref:threonine synthase n=1 Tax=Stomatohabitans albus TaxID=3110766 RepID=UPI00300CFB94